jgi:hypothetical protein
MCHELKRVYKFRQQKSIFFLAYIPIVPSPIDPSSFLLSDFVCANGQTRDTIEAIALCRFGRNKAYTFIFWSIQYRTVARLMNVSLPLRFVYVERVYDCITACLRKL